MTAYVPIMFQKISTVKVFNFEGSNYCGFCGCLPSEKI